MNKTALMQVAGMWANVAAAFLFVGIAIAIAAMIWEPRGVLICIVPVTVAFVAKQGEVRLLRSALELTTNSISSIS